MEVGMFQTPFIGPERSAREAFSWAVSQAVAADKAGFSEYWVGEHATLDWEGIPSPELVIAAAACQTSRIRLGPLAHLLPYHHPATLAVQTAWLSQILEGRYQLGIATGAYPTDAALRGITDMSCNEPMMREALDIMQRVWRAEPFQHQGAYWNAGYPEAEPDNPLRNTAPYGGTMPIAMTSLSENSSSMRFAAKNGFIPVSVYAGDAFLKTHFEIYRQTAEAHGRTVDRKVHRVVRDVVVADSDKEAIRLASSGVARSYMEYLLPTYSRFGVLQALVSDPSVTLSDIDPAYLAEHVWIVGSPETVREKFEAWFDRLGGGGFGTLLMYSHDYMDDPRPWEESMRRFAVEVAPGIGK